MRTARLAVAAAALAVLGSTTAMAGLPTFTTTTIQPGYGVAGFKLGLDLDLGAIVFGPADACAPVTVPAGGTRCTWSSTPAASRPAARFQLIAGPSGRVETIVMEGGIGGEALAVLQTPQGIGIGSTRARLVAAYPELQGPETSSPTLGAGRHTTTFTIRNGRVDAIRVGMPA